MPSRLIDPNIDPDYWRGRAEESRAQAEQTWDECAKRALLDIAENYDQIAQQQEGLALGSWAPKR